MIGDHEDRFTRQTLRADLRKIDNLPISSRELLYLETNWFSRTHEDLSPRSHEFNWVKGEDDGLFIANTREGLIIHNIFTEKKEIIVDKEDVLPNAEGYSLNADKSKVLWASNKTEVYRYSFTANYFIQDTVTKERKPLHPDQKGDIQLATWSPRQAFQISLWITLTATVIPMSWPLFGATTCTYGTTERSLP
jgi:hypothetical protein